MKLFVHLLRVVGLALALSVSAIAPAWAQTIDEGVGLALSSDSSAQVIMQFTTVAARDAAYDRLLDRGAAVRKESTEVGPTLIVLGRATTLATEFGGASQVSLDATVQILSNGNGNGRGNGTNGALKPARDRAIRRSLNFADRVHSAAYSVAVIDSGIQPHMDLPSNRISEFVDFVNAGNTRPVDGCGHGTHVAGIIAGSGLASDGEYEGIASGVNVVALRVLDNDCSGLTSDVIKALEWVGRNHDRHKIKVVNLSLGHAVLESIFTDPMVQAVERLSRKGIVVVTAAGNRGINQKKEIVDENGNTVPNPYYGKPGYGGVGVPCNAPSAICVGSLDTQGTPKLNDDQVADSSSRGPSRFDLLAKPDMVAAGVEIVSLSARGSRLFTSFPELRVNGIDGKPHYFILSGTSMASPAVAGAAAVMLAGTPNLTANTTKMVLQFTARLIKKTDVLTQGAGALNLHGALKLAKAINPSAPYGRNWITQRVTSANNDGNGNTINWSRRIIYGDRFMQPRYAEIHLRRWSDDFVWAWDAIEDNIVWGNDDNIVWGNEDNIVWGNEDNIVWGNDDNIVWGNSADDNIVWGNDESDNIVWGIDDNIVWGNDDNIVWGNTDDDNIVWGNSHLRDVWASNTVAGFWDDNIVWGNYTKAEDDNIVWGNDDDNIVWGNCSAAEDDNIVWGNDDNIVWGNCEDNIVWGNDDDNIVWGNSVLTGGRR